MINPDAFDKGIKWKKTSSRRVMDRLVRFLGYAAFGVLFIVLISIFGYIIHGGATTVTLKILTTNGNTSYGGIANAIWGTWELVGMGLLFSLPPGIFGAIYLTQSNSNKRVSDTMRLFTDMLTSVPSIVIGLFGYLVIVIKLNFGYSLVAGGIALSVMMLPYIMRISELSFRSISKEQVQNAYALGADHIQVFSRIYLPQASAGIFAGVLLAISIAAGETAQLIYTAGFSSVLPSSFTNSQVGYLTYMIWAGINQPTQYAHNIAFISAMVLILSITALIFISKYESQIFRLLHRVFVETPDSSKRDKAKLKKVK